MILGTRQAARSDSKSLLRPQSTDHRGSGPRCVSCHSTQGSLPNGSEFVSYVDAIGEIDGKRHLIDWKTTTSRYHEEPEGLLSLDPQLLCYSWMSGIRDVALVVFVRKHLPEIQYLKTSITEAQQKEFGQLVESTISQIEAGQFPAHSGIRFPMNGCTSCAHLGLCLGNQPLIDSKLIRRPGASDLDWLDQLE